MLNKDKEPILKMQKLAVTYKNNDVDFFNETQLDCFTLTLKGHAAALIRQLKENPVGIYSIDNYNAVLLEEIISVRIGESWLSPP